MPEHNVVQFPGKGPPPPPPPIPPPIDWRPAFEEDDLPQFLYLVQGLTDAEDEESMKRWMWDIKTAVSTWPL